MTQSLLSQYLVWHFWKMPRALAKAWRNYLVFGLNFFSLPLLLRTFFSPWHRYKWSYGRGFSFSRYIEVFVSNTFSRLLGAFMRVFLILFGLVAEIFLLVLGAIVFFGWLFLPAFLIAGLIFGFKLLSYNA